MSCSYKDCKFECYESNDKCIFHHNKEDWKSDSEEKIKYFWSEIRKQKNRINKQFIGFVFPKFEEFTEEIYTTTDGMHQIHDYSYIDNYTFGYRGNGHTYYSILENANFTNAIFLDTADFSKIYLNAITTFTNTTFEKDILFSWERLTNIIFDNIQFRQDINFDNYKINNCNFINTKFENKVSFVGGSFSSANFENSIFKKEVSFENSNMNGITNFKNTIFKKEANFENGSSMYVDFTESIFEGNALFSQREMYGNIEFSDITVKGKANFDIKNIQGTANFSNSTFEKEATFKNVEFVKEADFKNTTFKKEANFENGSFFNVDFTESTFEGDVLFSQQEMKGNVEFSGITVKGKANFDIKNIQGTANFSNSTFEKEITLKDIKVRGKADFKNIKFKEEANFENGLFVNLDFTRSSFEKDALFTRCSMDGIVNFNKCKSKNNIIFDYCKFKTNTYFNKMEADNIDFSNTKFLHENSEDSNYDLEFNDGIYGNIDFTDSSIGQNIIARKSSFKSIKFDRFNLTKWGSIEFRDLKIDSFIFNKYVNKSENVLFDFVTVNKKLEIKNVSFNEERFNHFNLLKANVEIKNSAFNDNFFNSVKWGTISDKRYTASRDIFRQLKFYSEQQKNFIDADGFYSLEMRERKKELREESKDLTNWSEKISHFFSHTMVFFIHEKTSDFSQNWFLPIFWLLILGMIGSTYLNLKIVNEFPLFATILYVVISAIIVDSILYIGLLYFDSKMKTSILESRYFIHLLVAIPVLIVYIHFTHDFLDDIARLINPSNIFKPIISNDSKEIKETFEFGYLLFKIAVLFLVYQVVIAMKKKVRSK